MAATQAAKQIHRELAELIQSLDSTFSGQVILPEEPLQQREAEGVTLMVVQFAVKPNDGIYKDCRVHFEIILNDSYPEDQPDVKCTDTVAHPNIQFDCMNSDPEAFGDVCVSVLDDWRDRECHRDLSSVVQGVLFLFHNPEVNDPLVGTGGISNLEILVEDTKQGGKPWDDSAFQSVTFTNVYEGPDVEPVLVKNKGAEPSNETSKPTQELESETLHTSVEMTTCNAVSDRPHVISYEQSEDLVTKDQVTQEGETIRYIKTAGGTEASSTTVIYETTGNGPQQTNTWKELAALQCCHGAEKTTEELVVKEKEESEIETSGEMIPAAGSRKVMQTSDIKSDESMLTQTVPPINNHTGSVTPEFNHRHLNLCSNQHNRRRGAWKGISSLWRRFRTVFSSLSSISS